jgi:hypothetical protein
MAHVSDPEIGRLGEFDPEAARSFYLDFPLFSRVSIESAARLAAAAAGRELLAPCGRSPVDAQIGDRSFAWRLSDRPGLIAKVLATSEHSTLRSWLSAEAMSSAFRRVSGLRIPGIGLHASAPVPWKVEEAALGEPATTSSLNHLRAFEVILSIQQIELRRSVQLDLYDRGRFRRNIHLPLEELGQAGVISRTAQVEAWQLANHHLERMHEFDPVLAHNDLAIHHIYVGDVEPWVIDWERPVRDRSLMLDVAHLTVNHGRLDLAWARRLCATAVSYLPDPARARSNLIVALLERTAGKALDRLRRQRSQARDAVQTLGAILNGDLIELAVAA